MSDTETWPQQHARLVTMADDHRSPWPDNRLAISAALCRIDELTQACRKALDSNAHRHGPHCACYTCVLLREVIAKAGA